LDYTYWFFDFFLSAVAVILGFILFRQVTGNFWVSLAGVSGFYLGLVFEQYRLGYIFSNQ
jgi:hypothetical protein